MPYTNSELASITVISPHWRQRTHVIDTITIHHAAAVGVSAAAIGQTFLDPKRGASANYGIGTDGQIVLIVPEDKRAITSNSASNDNRAITIEVANSAGAPDWPISSDSYAALILLLTDVCRRNHIPELRWRGDKSLIGQVDLQNMTLHKWFGATACPGPYLESRMGDIAAAVNERLGTGKEKKTMANEKRWQTIASLPEWSKQTVKKLCRLGVLEGKTTEKDALGYPAALDLSEDMVRMLVILDRAGAFDNVSGGNAT